MKTTLFALFTVSLFAIASASSFTDGMTTGFISSNIERKFTTKRNKSPTIKYNNFTRDTSLQKFPPIASPQCIMEKIKIVRPPLTLGEKFAAIVLTAALMLIPIHIMCFADDKTRDWFIGYMIGRILEDMFNGND